MESDDAPDPRLTPALRDAVTRMRAALDPLAERLTDHLVARIDSLADEPEIVDDLTRATREGTDAWLEVLLAREVPREVAIPAATVAVARAWVRRNRPVGSLLRAHRLAHGVVVQEMLSQLRAAIDDPQLLGLASETLVELSFGYIDTLSAGITELYLGERARLVRSAELARAEVVEALLREEPVDVDAAERRLGHPLRGHHVALLLWAEGGDPGEEPLSRLEAEAQRIADHLGGGRLLRIAAGGRLLWAWVAADRPLDDVPPPPPAVGPDEVRVHVALGAPAEGPTGFTRSHRDATEARRVAGLAARTPRAVRYRDVDLLALMTSDADRARRFVETRLGALGEEDDQTRRVRVTLRTFLEERGSHVAAARRLGVHENTVKYRVRRAEALLGRPLGDDPLALSAALRLADLLGAAEQA
ncbi:PucR family transcriptional regulator [Patulibacter defluvii]|uniref:PucR family transcriptional regulator n=1 Tax=Patulibacter defluvii TaxID=3095358 RepID=UPI002A756969|nr:helix-turn-helix domain-containing protein [Patulibacter sp. DM4]